MRSEAKQWLATLLILSAALFCVHRPADAARINPLRDHLVIGAGGDQLAAAGYDVIDDYSTYATARLTDENAEALRAKGLRVELLDHRTGRGAYFGDFKVDTVTIPLELRAGLDEPYSIVQFRGPVKAEWRAYLEALADEVVGYLPNNSFLVRLTSGARNTLAADLRVRHIEPWHPAFRLPLGTPPAGSLDMLVLAARDANVSALATDLAAAGAAVAGSRVTPWDVVVHIIADSSLLDEVARVRHVVALEPPAHAIVDDNEVANSMTQGGPGGLYPIYASGVNGSTQKSAMCDSGIGNVVVGTSTNQQPIVRFVHEMFDDPADGRVRWSDHLGPLPSGLPEHRKIDLYYTPAVAPLAGPEGGYHGTHTAGTLAGDGLQPGVYDGHDGIAYASRLVVCKRPEAPPKLNYYATYFDPARERGANIHSNSYRTEQPPWDARNQYGWGSRVHDAYTWDHPQFLIFRSTGNHYPLTYISTEPYAKSVVAVGNVMNDGVSQTMAEDSVGARLADGRIRPTLVAPGDCLMSAGLSGPTEYVCLDGTSMSTPTAAGAGVLIRDYFAKGFYPSGSPAPSDAQAPSAALVRALLMVSGVEISGDRSLSSFPNQAQGWGRIHLDNVLYFAGEARKLQIEDRTQGIFVGQTYTRTLQVAAGQPLRIMLAWSDYPALPGVNPAIVNDLDLEVVGPDGIRLGNAFVGSEVPAGSGKRNATWVEEGVYVTTPQAGTYTIKVRGTNVPMGPQPFALAVTGDVTWTGEGGIG